MERKKQDGKSAEEEKERKKEEGKEEKKKTLMNQLLNCMQTISHTQIPSLINDEQTAFVAFCALPSLPPPLSHYM